MPTKKSAKGSSSQQKGQASTQHNPTETETQSTTPAPVSLSASGSLFHLVQILLIVSFASLAVVASQLALHPLYGTTVSSLHMGSIMRMTCVISATRPNAPAHRILLQLSLLLAAAPFSARVLGSLTGRMDSSLWGPIITQFGLAIPIVGLSTSLLRSPLEARHGERIPTIGTTLLSSVIMAAGISFVEPILWRLIPFGGYFTSCNIFISLALLAGTISALNTPVRGNSPQQANRSLLSSALFASVPVFVALYSKSQAPCRTPHLPATYHTIYRPPITDTSALKLAGYRIGALPPPETYLNKTEEPRNVTVNLLARTDSVTGAIVVGEYVEEGIRFLRADHSILGGRWIGDRAHGESLGDSIYGAFTQQEAVRMVKRESAKEGDNALIIGLGIGIAAEALINHGDKVHIVEIDPAVYTYARGFFNLSEPHAVHLTDARQWVHERYMTLQSLPPVLFPDLSTNGKDGSAKHTSQSESATKFGMVIHDCFSGGGVPSHLFPLEFWEELKGIMTPDGVVAVNFAGHIGTPAARAIWFTLQKAFGTENGGRGCRVFHDRLETPGVETPPMQEDEFLNMVYFCQKDEGSQSGEKKTVEFRRAGDQDYLKSWLRYAVLSSMLDREVTKERITGLKSETGDSLNGEAWILTDKNNRLGEWQQDSAIEHWDVMRDVMPYSVWEIY
ncbi:hypothetical protein FRB91_002595 [Serendipita sp. 411]|nr:hypothetical protein FRB91_002595 [Serendipita sp. 411]